MEWMIGNVKIKNQVVLSPMAGVCNEPFLFFVAFRKGSDDPPGQKQQ